MVGGARKALYANRVALDDTTQRCSAWEEACYKEYEKRMSCARAYTELYDKHGATVNDLQHAKDSFRPQAKRTSVPQVQSKQVKRNWSAGFDFAATKENDLRSALASRSDFFHNLSQNG